MVIRIRHFQILSLFLSLLLLLSGCETLQQIDKGLYQVSEAVSETDRVTGQRSLSTADRAAQIRKGNAYVQQLLQQETAKGRQLNERLDARQYQRLVTIFDRVQRVSHLARERWQPILIDRDSFNAFTTGGTYIVVHLGLMNQLKSDDEVAAVVGHEIAHTVANHVFERQTHQMFSTLAGSSSARRSGYQAAFTHENEREADRIGILYAALAGFDPYAAARIWQRQYQAEGNARALFFHDHPVNAERAAENRRVADKVKPYYRKGVEHPQAASLLHNNVLWQRQSSAKAAGEGGGVEALLGTVLTGVVQHQQAKQEEYRQASQIRFVRAVSQVMSVEGSRVLDSRRWITNWRYRGNVSLKNVIMGAIFTDRSGKKYRLIAHVKGVIRPGARFSTEFKSTQLSVEQLRRMKLNYYVDDATRY